MLKPFKLKVMINEHAEGNLGAKRREKGEGSLLQDWQDLWYFSQRIKCFMLHEI